MAFVNPNEENPNAPENQQHGNQQGPVSSGGAGVGGATKQAATPGVNVPAQPSAQLSAYLAANAPQAAEFGQKVAQTVGGQVGAAGQAIQPAINAYTGKLYSVPTDPTVNAAVAQAPSSLTPEQRAAYQAQLGAQSRSPNSADTFETTAGYQDAASKIQGAVNQADLWNSGNDISSLTTALSPFESQNATAGARTLDALLLSRTPQAYGQIRQAVTPAAGFQDQLAAGTDAANDALRSTIAQNQATTDAARAAASSYASGLNQTLAEYLANAQGAVLDYNQNQVGPITQNLANVQPQIAALQNAIDSYNAILSGGPGATGVPLDLPGISFSPISYGQVGQIPQTATMPDVAQLATEGQYSDLAALRDLLGPDLFGSLNTTVTPDQASLAGTWQANVNAQAPNLGDLLDPLTSPVIQGLMPNVTAAQQFAPAVQSSAPLIQNARGVQEALDALLAAAGQQPWVGPVAPTPGGGTIPPPSGGDTTPSPTTIPTDVSQIPGITYNDQGFPIFPQGGSASNPQDVANWTAYYNYVQTLYPGLSIRPPWAKGIGVA